MLLCSIEFQRDRSVLISLERLLDYLIPFVVEYICTSLLEFLFVLGIVDLNSKSNH